MRALILVGKLRDCVVKVIKTRECYTMGCQARCEKCVRISYNPSSLHDELCYKHVIFID
jgi:hypothetical protein